MPKTSYLYEVLIRGTPDGQIKNAHMQYIDRYEIDGGEVIEKERAPEKLDVATVEALLGTEMANAGEQVAALNTEKTALNAEVTALTAQRDALLAVIQAARTSFEAVLNPPA